MSAAIPRTNFLRRLANMAKGEVAVRHPSKEPRQPERLTAKVKGEFYLHTVLGR